MKHFGPLLGVITIIINSWNYNNDLLTVFNNDGNVKFQKAIKESEQCMTEG